MVSNPQEYKGSSYSMYIGKEKGGLLLNIRVTVKNVAADPNVGQHLDIMALDSESRKREDGKLL